VWYVPKHAEHSKRRTGHKQTGVLDISKHRATLVRTMPCDCVMTTLRAFVAWMLCCKHSLARVHAVCCDGGWLDSHSNSPAAAMHSMIAKTGVACECSSLVRAFVLLLVPMVCAGRLQASRVWQCGGRPREAEEWRHKAQDRGPRCQGGWCVCVGGGGQASVVGAWSRVALDATCVMGIATHNVGRLEAHRRHLRMRLMCNRTHMNHCSIAISS
jgi:hypothetical protein